MHSSRRKNKIDINSVYTSMLFPNWVTWDNDKGCSTKSQVREFLIVECSRLSKVSSKNSPRWPLAKKAYH